MARHINLIETLELLPYPVPYDAPAILEILNQRMLTKRADEAVFNAAYRISPPRLRGQSTAEYLCSKILPPLWEAGDSVAATYMATGATLRSISERLSKFHGLGAGRDESGTFMRGQMARPLWRAGIGNFSM